MPNESGYGAPSGGSATAIGTPPAYGSYSGANPYQSGVADDMQRRVQQMLAQSFAGARSGAQAVNQVGGSREGVAQGIAGGQAADALAGQLAGMNSTNWNQSQNRDLSRYGMDQGFYTQNRGLDQSGVALGANIYDMANRNDWLGASAAGGIYGGYAGNGTSTTSGSQGGGWGGAIGGALGAAQLAKNFGWGW
jgi:hypothetical protein